MAITRPAAGHRRAWCAAVAVWSVGFAIPHVLWAGGSRWGLGESAAAADAALRQTWFAAYNLAAAGLGVVGAAVAVVLGAGWGSTALRRWLVRGARVAGVALLLRGALGLALLSAGTDERVPAILLAVEPWFALGGVACLGMARAAALPGDPAAASTRRET